MREFESWFKNNYSANLRHTSGYEKCRQTWEAAQKHDHGKYAELVRAAEDVVNITKAAFRAGYMVNMTVDIADRVRVMEKALRKVEGMRG